MTNLNGEYTPISAVDRYTRMIDINAYQADNGPTQTQSRYGGSALDAIRLDSIGADKPRDSEQPPTEVLTPDEKQWLKKLITGPDQEFTGAQDD